jgi:hypothetical protein
MPTSPYLLAVAGASFATDCSLIRNLSATCPLRMNLFLLFTDRFVPGGMKRFIIH